MLKSSDVDGLEGELGEGEAPAGTFGAAPVPASTAPPAASDKVDVLAEQEQRLRALARGLFRRLVLGEAGALAPYLAVEAQLRHTAEARAKRGGGGREEWEAELRAEQQRAAEELARKLGTAAGKDPTEMTDAELAHARRVLREHAQRSRQPSVCGGFGVVVLPPEDPEGTAHYQRTPGIYIPPEGDE